MGRFLTDLEVRLCGEDPEEWELTSPLIYESATVGIIAVPTGFRTNFASVPRLPGVYLILGGLAIEAAVLHDFLYTEPHSTGTGRRVTRAEADKVLLEAARESLGYCRAWALYAGVRLGGSGHFGAE